MVYNHIFLDTDYVVTSDTASICGR